jgi:hypothetical protein
MALTEDRKYPKRLITLHGTALSILLSGHHREVVATAFCELVISNETSCWFLSLRHVCCPPFSRTHLFNPSLSSGAFGISIVGALFWAPHLSSALLAEIKLTHDSPERKMYEVNAAGNKSCAVVTSRPYWLSFYAHDRHRVA